MPGVFVHGSLASHAEAGALLGVAPVAAVHYLPAVLPELKATLPAVPVVPLDRRLRG